MARPVRVIATVVAVMLTCGCVSYNPAPPARAGTTPTPAPAVSPSRALDRRPTALPSPEGVLPIVLWVKLTPEDFNPRCEPTYSAVLTVTAKVTDPDTAPSELAVTATWSAGTRTGDIQLVYRPGDSTFAGELPRVSAQEAAAPNRPPLVRVIASDSPGTRQPSLSVFASVPTVCLMLSPLTNHAYPQITPTAQSQIALR